MVSNKPAKLYYEGRSYCTILLYNNIVYLNIKITAYGRLRFLDLKCSIDATRDIFIFPMMQQYSILEIHIHISHLRVVHARCCPLCCTPIQLLHVDETERTWAHVPRRRLQNLRMGTVQEEAVGRKKNFMLILVTFDSNWWHFITLPMNLHARLYFCRSRGSWVMLQIVLNRKFFKRPLSH